MTKNFFFNLFIFLSILLIGQYIFFFKISPLFSQLNYRSGHFEQMTKDIEGDFDMILCGSSINKWTAKDDVDKRSISSMLDDLLADCTVLGVSRPAANLSYYDSVIKYVNSTKPSNNTKFLIEVSLETFASTWTDPMWSKTLRREEILWKNNFFTAFLHPLEVFKYDFGDISNEEFQNTIVFHGDKNEGALKDFLQKPGNKKSKRYISQYLGKLDNDNPVVKDLVKLIELGQESQTELYFFITPMNYTKGIEFIPKTFENILDSNRQFLADLLNSKNSKFIDLSKTLDASHFTHNPFFPNGHLDQIGRLSVAKKLSTIVNCGTD